MPDLARQTFLFFGAGQANIGAAQLLTLALAQQGLSAEEAKSRIWLVDSKVRPCDFQRLDFAIDSIIATAPDAIYLRAPSDCLG